MNTSTATTSSPRESGTVRWFDTTTGLGGITPDDVTILPSTPESGYRHAEVVLHYADMRASVSAGERVSFEVFQTERATTALNVKRENSDDY